MLKGFSENDFGVLRGPFESGRQSPGKLGTTLILLAIFQPLIFFLVYIVAGDATIFPYKDKLFGIHLVITCVFILLSIPYMIPVIYKKGQKMQYLLVILASQNIGGICFYLGAMFLIGQAGNVTINSLLTFTLVTLSFGLLIFLVTCIRFYFLLSKGKYRKGSKKDKLRSNTENIIKSYSPMIIVGSVGLLFTLQYLVRTLGAYEIDEIVMITIFILIFFTMLFVLPEQLVILYCKYRFKSFNYSENGNLNPMGTD